RRADPQVEHPVALRGDAALGPAEREGVLNGAGAQQTEQRRPTDDRPDDATRPCGNHLVLPPRHTTEDAHTPNGQRRPAHDRRLLDLGLGEWPGVGVSAGGYRGRVADPAYLDAASSAPMHPAARQALAAALDDGWADPEKLYQQARRARHLLDAARGATAEVLGVRAEELTFTPSGSDACHRAVQGVLRGR